jgi:hypothetical protein
MADEKINSDNDNKLGIAKNSVGNAVKAAVDIVDKNLNFDTLQNFKNFNKKINRANFNPILIKNMER